MLKIAERRPASPAIFPLKPSRTARSHGEFRLGRRRENTKIFVVIAVAGDPGPFSEDLAAPATAWPRGPTHSTLGGQIRHSVATRASDGGTTPCEAPNAAEDS